MENESGKKNKKQISFQLKLERRHWLSTSDSKQWEKKGSDCMYYRDSITTESMQQCREYKSFWGGIHHAPVFFPLIPL